MAKTEMIRARVEPELKYQAEEVFSGLGLSPTEAITLFYRQVTLHHGLPFAVKVPNAETLAQERDSPNTPTWRISKLGTVDRCAYSPRGNSRRISSVAGSAARISTRSGVSWSGSCRNSLSIHDIGGIA